MSSQPTRFPSALLKISGECFSEEKLLDSVVDQLVRARRRRVRLAVVVGGGNILRGRDVCGLDRAIADQAGMLATVINGIRLTATLSRELAACHLTARGIRGFVDEYQIERARERLDKGDVLVLTGGTGNPFFSTDTAAALRAAELGLAVLLKGTNVGGVYSADPRTEPAARLYRRLTYRRALDEGLRVMDLTAFALCMERRIPIVVFDVTRPGNIIKAIMGKPTGSRVC